MKSSSVTETGDNAEPYCRPEKVKEPLSEDNNTDSIPPTPKKWVKNW